MRADLPLSQMLSPSQTRTFEISGLLRLRGMLRPETAGGHRENILRLARRSGAWNDGVWIPRSLEERRKLLKRVRKSTKLGSFVSPEVYQLMVELVGRRPITPWSDQPELLFSLTRGRAGVTAEPAEAVSSEPRARRQFAWHVDVDRLPESGVTGVQFFTFLDTVEPGGGATVAVTGSHRLANDRIRRSFADVKAELTRRPFFQDLFSQDRPEDTLGAAGQADGVDLQVVELVGEPGDVYLMDLRVLHSRSPNTRETARMMVTQRFLLESVRHQVKRRY